MNAIQIKQTKTAFPIIILLLLIIMFSSCGSDYEDKTFKPVIIDTNQVLSSETKEWIAQQDYPKGLFFEIYTVDSVSQALIGAEADEAFENQADKQDTSDVLEERGVFIYVSQKPSLVQLRAGSDIYFQSLWKGIAAGENYIEIQDMAQAGKLDSAVVALLNRTREELPKAIDLPWYKDLLYNSATQTLSSELGDLSLPSESFYGNNILKPVLSLRALELKHFGTWWMTYIVLAFMAWLVRKLIDILFLKYIEKALTYKFAKPLQIGVGIGIDLLFAIPAAASAVVLAGARLEDQLALISSGIPYIETLSFDVALYNVTTGWWLALLMIVLFRFKKLFSNFELHLLGTMPPEKQQKLYTNYKKINPFGAFILKSAGTRGRYGEEIVDEEEFEQSPYKFASHNTGGRSTRKAILWGLLAWLFLPKALSLAAIYFWIIPIISGFIKLPKVMKKMNKDFGIDRVTAFGFLIAPLILALVLFLIKIGYKQILYFSWFIFSPGLTISTVINYFFPSMAYGYLWIAVGVMLIATFVFLVEKWELFEYPFKAILKYFAICAILTGIAIGYSFIKEKDNIIVNTVLKMYPVIEMNIEGTDEAGQKALYMVNAGTLNFRKGAGTNFKSIQQLSRGDTLELLDSTSGDWWKVKYKDKKGFVFSKYIKELITNK